MFAEHIGHITNAVIEDVMLWQNRPLEHVYIFVFMDQYITKIGDDSKIKNKDSFKEFLRILRDNLDVILSLFEF